MIKFEGLLLVISLALVLFSFIDCARRDETELQKLPKWAWLLLIFFTGTLGSIGYLILGRTNRNLGRSPKPKKRILPPDDDPDFLRSI